MPDIVAKRVNRLENLMTKLLATVDRVDRQLEQTELVVAQTQRNIERDFAEMRAMQERSAQEMRQLKTEMREFKETTQTIQERSAREMHEFKDATRATQERSAQEMREFKDEMREFKDEMHEFKDEMREFKDEMHDFRDKEHQSNEEFRKFMTDHKKAMGELSRKMGTMVEDLVVPSIPRILHQTIGCPKDGIKFMAIRVKKLHPLANIRKEYDVVVVCGGYLLVNETKSRLTPEHIKNFAEEVLPQVREFFPEYKQKKVIGAIASLYVEESLVRFGERLGLIVSGFGEDVMDVLNQPGFIPKEF